MGTNLRCLINKKIFLLSQNFGIIVFISSAVIYPEILVVC